MNVKAAELYVLLSEENENILSIEADYPLGSKKEVDKMVANNLSSMLKEDESLYYHSWRLLRSYSNGKGLYQIASVRKEYIDAIHSIAEHFKLKFCRADLSNNAVESLAQYINDDRRHGRPSEDTGIIVEVGHRNVRVVAFTGKETIRTYTAPHNLHRMDKLILETGQGPNNDDGAVPELLKMNPAYALRVSQYEGFLDALSADIIRFIKQAVSETETQTLDCIYFTGGMYKMPKLVSNIKESLDVPCYAFPISDYMQMKDNCIQCIDTKLYPSVDAFAASLGVLIGGI